MITDGTNFAKYNNFSSNEFKCKCCNKLKISEIVLDFCQAWRNHIQEGVTINSAYRCPEHNSKVSSTGDSGPHTTGFAVDIATSPQKQYQLLDFALHWDPKPSGIGIAKSFTHLDWLTVDVDQKYVVRPNVWKY